MMRPILGTDERGDIIKSIGHHTVLKYNDKYYIIYHRFNTPAVTRFPKNCGRISFNYAFAVFLVRKKINQLPLGKPALFFDLWIFSFLFFQYNTGYGQHLHAEKLTIDNYDFRASFVFDDVDGLKRNK